MNFAAKDAGAGLPAHELIYRRLRDMVLFGDLQPGQPVTIQGLVDTLAAGTTPVREALRRLTAEGALHALGNRRIVVPVLSPEDVEELSVARVSLEPVLAARAVAYVDEDTITQLAKIDARLDDAIKAGDIPSYLRRNHAFHALLNETAKSPILKSVVDGLWLRFGPSQRMICGQIGTRAQPDRHKDLLVALRNRDCDAAFTAMREDVEQGMDLILGATRAACDSIDSG